MNAELQDRLRGALIGLAVADALGAAVEFRSPGSFAPVTGFRGGGPHGLGPGEWTDDTSLALALADSIAHAGWDLDDQAKRYLEWYRSGRYSVNGRCFDIGIQTSGALRKFERTGDARSAGNRGEEASGNGSIMRLAPIPIAFAHLYPDHIETLADRAEESSIPTHPSFICRSCCRYLAVVTAGLAHGVSREEVLSPSWPPLERLGPLHPAVEEVAQGSFRRRQPPEIRGAGYVVKSLEAALWAFYNAPDFSTAVLNAVNLGDDSDTTGAVCGQLAGACWGESGIPDEWRTGLARPDLLEKALTGLLTNAGAPKSSDSPGPSGKADAVLPSSAILAEPPSWSYWVDRGRFLAGCFPGAKNPSEHRQRIQQLLDTGVRVFISLMYENETDHDGDLFVDYSRTVAELAAASELSVHCLRFPVRDVSTPSTDEMETILDAIDGALPNASVYLHCWGGIGRTGTVACCWLLRHGVVDREEVFARLSELRVMDKVRGHRRSPETGEQERFVRQWADRCPRSSPANSPPA